MGATEDRSGRRAPAAPGTDLHRDRLYRGVACPHVFVVALVNGAPADEPELTVTCPECGPRVVPAREPDNGP